MTESLVNGYHNVNQSVLQKALHSFMNILPNKIHPLYKNKIYVSFVISGSN